MIYVGQASNILFSISYLVRQYMTSNVLENVVALFMQDIDGDVSDTNTKGSLENYKHFFSPLRDEQG